MDYLPLHCSFRYFEVCNEIIAQHFSVFSELTTNKVRLVHGLSSFSYFSPSRKMISSKTQSQISLLRILKRMSLHLSLESLRVLVALFCLAQQHRWDGTMHQGFVPFFPSLRNHRYAVARNDTNGEGDVQKSLSNHQLLLTHSILVTTSSLMLSMLTQTPTVSCQLSYHPALAP